MKIYCLEDFKVEFEKLTSKSTYRDLEKEIINYFFDKKIGQLSSGTRLNNSDDTPYIKKRLKGSGGYRTYYLLLIKDEYLYLMFVHPKSGSLGASNINDESKAYLYKKVLKSIKNNDVYKLKLDERGKYIKFEKA